VSSLWRQAGAPTDISQERWARFVSWRGSVCGERVTFDQLDGEADNYSFDCLTSAAAYAEDQLEQMPRNWAGGVRIAGAPD